MPFNKDITGYENEDEFVAYLNHKKFKQLTPIYQDLLKALYPNISWNDQIICKPNFGKQKGDIILSFEGVLKRISIKKGVKNSVHIEPIEQFISFLDTQGIPKSIQTSILKYHYADGTIDGTGKHRLSVKDHKLQNQIEIDNINETLNNNSLISQLINRFVLVGNNSEHSVDALIYGVTDDFLWATREEIKYIILEQLKDYSTSIHFSCLSYQPMTRNLNYNAKYENKRHYIQIKWYNLSDDLIKILCIRKYGKNYKEILNQITEKYLPKEINSR